MQIFLVTNKLEHDILINTILNIYRTKIRGKYVAKSEIKEYLLQMQVEDKKIFYN